jgi:hypothetical protein
MSGAAVKLLQAIIAAAAQRRRSAISIDYGENTCL